MGSRWVCLRRKYIVDEEGKINTCEKIEQIFYVINFFFLKTKQNKGVTELNYTIKDERRISETNVETGS